MNNELLQEKLQKHLGFLEQDQDNVNLRLDISNLYQQLGDFDSAMEILLPVLDSENPYQAQLGMARLLHKQFMLDEAIAMVEYLLAENPDDAQALGLLALLYFDQNEGMPDLETALRALELDENCYDAKLVTILTNITTNKNSVAEIEALIKQNQEDVRLWFALGSSYMIQGNMDAAEKTLLTAIEKFPSAYDTYISLAWVQLFQDEIDKAEQTYTKATKLEPEFADGWSGLALVAVLKGEFDKVPALIDKSQKLDAEDFLCEVAQALFSAKQNPEQFRKELTTALSNTKTTTKDQLVLIMEHLQDPTIH